MFHFGNRFYEKRKLGVVVRLVVNTDEARERFKRATDSVLGRQPPRSYANVNELFDAMRESHEVFPEHDYSKDGFVKPWDFNPKQSIKRRVTEYLQGLSFSAGILVQDCIEAVLCGFAKEEPEEQAASIDEQRIQEAENHLDADRDFDEPDLS